MLFTDCHPEERSDEGHRTRSCAPERSASPPRCFVAALLCMTAGGALLIGCSGYTGPRSVVNDDPAVKIPQIRRAVDAKDKSVEPQLVKDLDSDDAAVRFYSIGALARLNDGERFDYDWTIADRLKRAESIAKWNAFIAARNGTTTRASDE